MFLSEHSRFSRAFNVIIKGCLPAFLCWPFLIKAQDTLSLRTVEVSASKNNLSQTGKRMERTDSLTKEQFRFNSIADLLQFNSQMFIKTYGPGALSTTAFRGGNAYHTAILWNGFNLQNAMLGQSDLALMPSFLFENIEVEHGGSSALWGSGAVAGSIHLNNHNIFGSGLKTTVNLGTASFGLANGATSLVYSFNRFVSSTKLYMVNAQNNYTYRDTLDKENPIKKQNYAAYRFTGIMQQFKFLLSKREVAELNLWLNSNNRRLPGFNPVAETKTWQKDNAFRLNLSYTRFGSKLKSATRGAYFVEKINYTDSLLPVYSLSRVNTLMLENDNYLNWGHSHQANFGVSFSSNNAISDNYAGRAIMNRFSLLAGNKWTLSPNRFLIYSVARMEHYSNGSSPLTGNVSVSYKPWYNIELGANAAKLFRQPTLNELFWVPGGNKQLLPEQGYSIEGNAEYKKQVKRLLISLAGSAYSRSINNWVLWVPGAGANPTPQNIQLVWSRGTESVTKVVFAKSKLKLGLSFMSSYVLSTIRSSTQQNSATTNRQLIYTPRYAFNTKADFMYAGFYSTLLYNYTGYRFTTSDNSSWLPPYHLFGLRAGYKTNYHNSVFSLFAACNNLLNTNYRVVAGRPMPLRNYELGISIQTTKNRNNHQNKNLNYEN